MNERAYGFGHQAQPTRTRDLVGVPIGNDVEEPNAFYFGPPVLRKEWERQIPTPVGDMCQLCEELILDGDVGTSTLGMGTTHYECMLRTVVGSVAHLEGRCSCFVPGAEEGDPPGMTKREAALAAARLFHERGWIAPPDPNAPLI